MNKTYTKKRCIPCQERLPDTLKGFKKVFKRSLKLNSVPPIGINAWVPMAHITPILQTSQYLAI